MEIKAEREVRKTIGERCIRCGASVMHFVAGALFCENCGFRDTID